MRDIQYTETSRFITAASGMPNHLSQRAIARKAGDDGLCPQKSADM
jgi:hypothetical protein